MTVNLHTHTFRCGHARGKEREYIERAIEAGMTHLGFADHAPFVFPDGYQSRFRVPMEQAEDYMSTIRALREEYRGQIEIYIGFEMEYYPRYFSEMLRTVTDLGAEYLICGQHYIGNEYPGSYQYVGDPDTSRENLKEYADTLIEAVNSGVFTYIAHPDVFHFEGDEEVFVETMRPVCRRAAELKLPLEINLLGVRSQRHYPRESFWRIAGEEGCLTVLGSDAHSPKATYDEMSIPFATALVQRYGLRLVEHPVLIDPKTKEKHAL